MIVVHGKRGQDSSACQQSSKITQVALIASACKDFHLNGVADRNLGPEQLFDTVASRRTRVTQECNPRRGVDQDHRDRLVRIPSRSPSQPDPRSLCASSRSSGSVASIRSAKLTASLLVERWYRCMTMLHAASSMSTLVRAIHHKYTNTGLSWKECEWLAVIHGLAESIARTR